MKKAIATLSITALMAGSASAQEFFSTASPDSDFTFGARIGLNTANRTVSHEAMPGYNVQSWGTGFDLGAVVNINIKNYLSLQPGLFFESRSGDYTFVTPVADENLDGTSGLIYATQAGHLRNYNFTVPVMASFHFNLSPDIRWDVEAGPYFQFLLGSSLKNKALTSTFGNAEPLDEPLFTRKPKGFDFGLKFGTGLRLFGHYTVAVHYEAGFLHAWKNLEYGNLTYSYGGCNKAWLFTVGYDF